MKTKAAKLFTLLSLGISTLASCGGSNYDTKVIKFNTDGGTPIDDITVPWGKKFTSAEIPSTTKEGHTLVNWYADAQKTTAFTEAIIEADTTLYAKWSVNAYKVHYLDGDDTAKELYPVRSFNYGTDVALPTPTKTNVTFVGWYTSANRDVASLVSGTYKMPATDITLYAGWSNNYYDVTFAQNGDAVTGEMANVRLSYGGNVTLPANVFNRVGYTFAGWNTAPDGSGTAYANQGQITNFDHAGPLVLYAQWKANHYKVNFYDYNEKLADLQLEGDYRSQLVIPDSSSYVRARAGFEFQGWGTLAKTKDTSFNDAKLYYQVESGVATPLSFAQGKVAFDSGVALYEATALPLDYAIQGETNLFAIYTRKMVVISFVSEGGEAVEAVTGRYGQSVVLPTPVYAGHTFNGWYEEGASERYHGTDLTVVMPAEAVTLHAHWTLNQYKISFLTNTTPTSLPSVTLDYGAPLSDALPEASALSKPGYSLEGWAYSDQTPVLPTDTVPAKNITLSAQWSANELTVSYHAGEGTGETYVDVKTFGEEGYASLASIQDAGFACEGHDFKGWNTKEDGSGDDVLVLDAAYFAKSSSAIDLYAQWTVNKYTVNYHSGMDSIYIAPIKPDYGTALNQPPLAQNGYRFDGWFYDANFTQPVGENDTVPAHNVDLYGKWRANSLQVNYHANQGEGTVASTSHVYNQGDWTVLTSERFTRQGYTFGGWNTKADGTGSTISSLSLSQLTEVGGTLDLYAMWASNVLTIQYYGNGSTAGSMPAGGSEHVFEVGTWSVLPENGFIKQYHHFTGWKDADGNDVSELTANDFASGFVGGKKTIALYAQWAPNTIEIQYDDGEGQGVPQAQQKVYGEEGYKEISSVVPTLTGHTFSHWADGSGNRYDALTDASFATDQAVIALHAVYTKNGYKVNYVPGNGDEIHTITVEYQDAFDATVLPSLTRPGYDFVGWFYESGRQAKIDDLMPAEDITLTARWNAHKVALSYYPNATNPVSGMPEGIVLTYEEGDYLSLSDEVPSWQGFTFQGWNTKEDGSGETRTALTAEDFYGESLHAIDLYAQWAPNTMRVVFNANDAVGSTHAANVPNAVDHTYRGTNYGLDFLTDLSVPTRYGYTFGGYYRNPECTGDPVSALAEDDYAQIGGTMTLYAKWTAKTLSVEYRKGVVESEEDTVTNMPESLDKTFDQEGYAEISSVVPVREGFTFLGWFIAPFVDADQYRVQSFADAYASSSIILYAGWSENDYTVTYDAKGGTSVNTDTLNFQDEIQLPSTTRTGYTFDGWYYKDGPKAGTKVASGDKMPSQNLTLEAVWTVNTIALTYASNDAVGSTQATGMPASKDHVYGSEDYAALASVEPTRPGYTFGGWYRDAACSSNQKVTSLTGADFVSPTGTLTLYAKWTPVTINLHYHGNGANPAYEDAVSGRTFDSENWNVLTDAFAFAKDYYHRSGWVDVNNAPVTELTVADFSNPDQLDLHLYVNWVGNTLHVTYLANNDTEQSQAYDVVYGSENYKQLVSGSLFSKTGYSFAGWFIQDVGTIEEIDDSRFAIDDASLELKASWTINQYALTSIYDNGQDDGVNQVTYGQSLAAYLSAPAKTGYAFVKWVYASGEEEGEEVLPTDTMPAEGVSIRAIWVEDYVTLTVNANLEDPEALGTYRQNYDTFLYQNTYKTNQVVDFAPISSAILAAFPNFEFASAVPTEITMFAEGNTLSLNLSLIRRSVSFISGSDEIAAYQVAHGTHVLHDNALDAAVAALIPTGHTAQYKVGESTYASYTDIIATGDLVIEVVAQVNTNALTVHASGGKFASNNQGTRAYDSFAYGTSFDEVEVPTYLGYSFAGWYLDSSYDTPAVSMGDDQTTIYAKWTANRITLVYDAGLGSGAPASSNRTFGASGYLALSSDTPIREGYDFAGWFRDSEGSGDPVEVLSNNDFATNGATVTLYAKWVIRQHSISYDSKGGPLVDATDPLDYGTVIGESRLPQIAKDGYLFSGWFYENGTPVAATDAIPDADLLLVAHWQAKTLQVIYHLNDGSEITDTVNLTYDGEGYAAPSAAIFARTGYTFGNWYGNAETTGDAISDLTASYVNAENTLHLYAKWNANTLTVRFHAMGGTGTMEEINKAYGESGAMNVPNNGYAKTGYHFTSWYRSETPSEETKVNGFTDADYAASANVIDLYAGWEANLYTLAYVTEVSSAPVSVKVAYEEAIGASRVTPLAQDGYTFDGWFIDEQCLNQATSATKMALDGLTLYAKWTAHTLTIIYDGNGATAGSEDSSERTYSVSGEAWSEIPTSTGYTKTNYHFAGWKDEAGHDVTALTVDDFAAASGELHLIAQWEANSINIVYHANGKTATGMPASASSTYGATGYDAISDATPSVAHYRFDGWFRSQEGGVALTNLANADFAEDGATITLYAHWTAYSLNVVYQGNGEGATNLPESVLRTYGEEGYTVIPTTEATRSYYRFDGWYDNAEGKGDPVTALDDTRFVGVGATLNLYAKWTAYSINLSYDLNGGSASIPASTNTYDQIGYTALTDVVPTRAGYTFDGWYRDLSDANSKITALANSDFTSVGKAMTLYARYLAHTIDVTYNGNGASSGAMALEHKVYSDDPASLSWQAISENAYSHTGYHFVGWNTKADGTGKAYAPSDFATAFAFADFETELYQQITLFAQWEANTLTVFYHKNDGSVLTPTQIDLTYDVGGYKQVASSDLFGRLGYDFTFWYADPEDPDSKVTAFGDSYYSNEANTIHLYAGWQVQVYTLTYDTAGGTHQNSAEIAFNENLILPSVSKDGYVFSGWYYVGGTEDGEPVSASDKMPASNVTIIAHWTAKSIHVVYRDGQGNEADSDHTYDPVSESWKALSANAFAKTGYYWAGWKQGENAKEALALADFLAFEGQSTTITLDAIWAPKVLHILFQGNYGQGSMDEATFTYGEGTYLGTIDCLFHRPGYHFTGWADKDDNPFAAITASTYAEAEQTITLYAQWAVNTLKVSYNANGATGTVADSDHTYDPDSNIWTILSASEFAKTYYHFDGWYRNAECTGEAVKVLTIDDLSFDDVTQSNGTLTLYAKWAPNLVTVVYNGNGADGDEVANTRHFYGEEGYLALTEVEPTRTGHEFLGWNLASDGSGEAVAALTDAAFLANNGVVSLYAQWSVKSYELSYESNGGDAVAKVTVEYGTPLGNERLPIIAKLGYTFLGWYFDADFKEEAYNVTTMPARNATLYAKWVASKDLVYYAEGVALYNAGEVNLDSDFHDYVKGLYYAAESYHYIYGVLQEGVVGNQLTLGTLIAYIKTYVATSGHTNEDLVAKGLLSNAISNASLIDNLVAAYNAAKGDREKFITMMVMGIMNDVAPEDALLYLSCFNGASGDFQGFVTAMLEQAGKQTTKDATTLAQAYMDSGESRDDFIAIMVTNETLPAATAKALLALYKADQATYEAEGGQSAYGAKLIQEGYASDLETATALTTAIFTVAGAIAIYDAAEGDETAFAQAMTAKGATAEEIQKLYSVFYAFAMISGDITAAYRGVTQIKAIISAYDNTSSKADFVNAIKGDVGEENANMLYSLFDARDTIAYAKGYYQTVVDGLAGLPIEKNAEYYGIVSEATDKEKLEVAATWTSEKRQASLDAYLYYEDSAFDPIPQQDNYYFDSWKLSETETEVQKTAVWVYKLPQVTGLSQTHTSTSVTFVWDSVKNAANEADPNVWGYQIKIYRKSQLFKEINQYGVENCSYTVEHLEEGERVDIEVVALFKASDGSIRLNSYSRTVHSLIDGRELTVPAHPLSSDVASYSYVNNEAAAIDFDNVTAGAYYYIEDRGDHKDLYLFSECSYQFPGRTIVSSDETVAKPQGDVLNVTSKLPPSGTITITIGGTDYVAHINPLLNNLDLGKSIKSYQEAVVSGNVGLDTDPDVYYGTAKEALTVGLAKKNVAENSSYRKSDYQAEIGDDRYYNGVKLDVVAKSSTGATIDNANFKYDVAIEGWTLGTDYLYDTETTSLYLLKTGTAVITATPAVAENIYVPQAYLENAATYAKTYTVNVVDGYNVYSHDAMRAAYADTSLATINILSDIEVEFAASMVPYVDYVVAKNASKDSVLLKDNDAYHGDVDIENNTAVMKWIDKTAIPTGHDICRYKKVAESYEGYKFLAIDENGNAGVWFAYDANGDYYIDHGAKWVQNISGGHFKIINQNASSTDIATFEKYGLEFGYIYNRYNSGDTSTTELTINGNYYTFDASNLRFIYSSYKVTASSSWAAEYNIQNINSAVFANYGHDDEATAEHNEANINFKNFTLYGNTVNTSKYYSGSEENLKEDMEQHSGGILGFVSRPWSSCADNVSTDPSDPEYMPASEALSGGYHVPGATAKITLSGVNIYNTLIGVHSTTYSDLDYVRIDNSWASSIYSHSAATDSVMNIKNTVIGTSGGPAIDIEDQLYKFDPTLNIDYSTTTMSNMVGGEEPWFKAYKMEVTVMGLKGNFETIVKSVTSGKYTMLREVTNAGITTEQLNFIFFGRVQDGEKVKGTSDVAYINILNLLDSSQFVNSVTPPTSLTGGVETTFLFGEEHSYFFFKLYMQKVGVMYGLLEIFPVS